jgi:excisionase family DNA binding protein
VFLGYIWRVVPHTLYSLEDVASRLGLNVRTVRGYVRSGRLQAVKIGKQYRVSRESLEALTGNSDASRNPSAPSRQRKVDVSSVIEISAASPELASRISTLLIGAAGSNRATDAPLRVETIHDPVRGSIKIVVIGDLMAAADLFRLVQVVLDQ